mmetsp:Transcript_40420/g.86060  ORF Transcript_40420/g.86060 Transcript_40420/m.86060 type:complete len:245 (+) Transcript_40420:1525-2259(+)
MPSWTTTAARLRRAMSFIVASGAWIPCLTWTRRTTLTPRRVRRAWQMAWKVAAAPTMLQKEHTVALMPATTPTKPVFMTTLMMASNMPCLPDSMLLPLPLRRSSEWRDKQPPPSPLPNPIQEEAASNSRKPQKRTAPTLYLTPPTPRAPPRRPRALPSPPRCARDCGTAHRAATTMRPAAAGAGLSLSCGEGRATARRRRRRRHPLSASCQNRCRSTGGRRRAGRRSGTGCARRRRSFDILRCF